MDTKGVVRFESCHLPLVYFYLFLSVVSKIQTLSLFSDSTWANLLADRKADFVSCVSVYVYVCV